MKRKPPYRHDVSSHTRAGTRVNKYPRGKGDKPRKKNRAIRGSPAGYSLTIHYPGEPSENVNVSTGTYTGAVREAFKRIHTPKVPNRVVVRRLKT